MTIDQMHYGFKLGADKVDSSDLLGFEPYEIDEYLNQAIWNIMKDRYGVKLGDGPKRGFETDSVRIAQLSALHIKSPVLQPAIQPRAIGETGSGLYELRLNDLGRNISGQYFRCLFVTDAYVKARKDGCDKYIPLDPERSVERQTVFSDPSWTWSKLGYSFGRSTYQHPHFTPTGSTQHPDSTAEIENLDRYNNDELVSLYLITKDKYGTPQFDIDEVYVSYVKYPNRVFIGGYDHIDGQSKNDSPQIHCDLDDMIHDEIVREAIRLSKRDMEAKYEAYLQDKVMDSQY
jgi:hypothetical protein